MMDCSVFLFSAQNDIYPDARIQKSQILGALRQFPGGTFSIKADATGMH